MNKPTIITVNRNVLFKAVCQVSPARSLTTQCMPWAYTDYIFDVRDGQLYIMTSDFWNCNVCKQVEAEIETEATERQLFAVPHTIRKALKLLGDEPIRMAFGHSQVEVTHANGSFFMALDKDKDFSAEFEKKEDAVHTVKIEVPDFRHFIESAQFCIHNDELRPALSGLCFDFRDDHLVLASSDGHVLCMVEAYSVPADFKHTFIVKRKAVDQIYRMLPKVGWVELSIIKEQIRLDVTDGNSGQLTIVTKPVDGRYPNYLQVLPQHNEIHITVNRKQLLNAVMRADLFANDSSRLLLMVIHQNGTELVITSKDGDFECGATEKVPVTYDKLQHADGMYKDDIGFRIGFKSTHLEQILKHIHATDIIINAQDDKRATLFTPAVQDVADDSVTYLLMPMLVSE